MSVRVELVHDPVGHALLVDLSVVDLLLEGVVGDEAVDVSLLLLAVPAKEQYCKYWCG